MKTSGKGGRAFTVIELLVVIGIIMILAGILVPVLVGARARAKIRLAKATMRSMCVALDRYYADLGCYPPDTGDFDGKFAGDACQDGDTGGDDKYSLYRYLCGAKGLGIIDPRTGRRHGPFMTFKATQLLDGGGADDERIAIDAWGEPWVYEESLSYSLLRPGAPELGTYNPTHHPTRYDIYSVGPDLELDPGSHNMLDDDDDGSTDEPDEAYFGGGSGDEGDEGDDITNWW